MKKSLVWAAVLGVVLTLNSCGGDDPEPVPAIVGTWARASYEFTELPTGFTKYWEGYDPESLGESGYTLVFKADGTYTRAFVAGDDSVYDEGTYTLDGTSLKLSPKDAGDLDKIDEISTIGIEFSVLGDVTEVRLELAKPIAFELPSDAAIDAAEGNFGAIPDEDWHVIDFTLVYKFNRLN
jgi:hypothetical protein